MSYTPVHNQNISKRSTLVMFLISLVSLFAVGCGSSSEDFVITGNNNNNPANTGNVVFQFVKPQAATVPAATTTLAFDFYSTDVPANGTLIFSATSAFANTVTVLNVPTETRSVIITAYDADGNPLATIFSTLVVVGGVNNPTNLTNADVDLVTFDSISVSPNPVALTLGTQTGGSAQLTITGSFSNGENIVFDTDTYATDAVFGGNNAAVATVSNGGLVTGVSNGSTSVDVDYTVNGVTRSQLDVAVNVTGGVIDVDTLSVAPTALSAAPGASTSPVVVTFTAAGQAGVDVTDDVETTYAVSPANADFTANDDGTVDVGAGASEGETATIVVTYDNNGTDLTDSFTVTAQTPVLQSVTFAVPPNALELPAGGIDFQLVGVETYSDNSTQPADPADYNFFFGNNQVAQVSATGLLTTGNAGTTDITISNKTNNTIADSFTLTVSNVTVSALTVSPDTFALNNNELDTATYSVSATYSNGNTANLTNSPDVAFTSTASGTSTATFSNGTVDGGMTGTANIYNVNFNGGSTLDTVTVTNEAVI